MKQFLDARVKIWVVVSRPLECQMCYDILQSGWRIGHVMICEKCKVKMTDIKIT